MDFKVQIEIPAGSGIKYEVNTQTGELVVDRFLHTAFTYPFNYGYIKDTLGGDGDPVDALVLSTYPVQAGAVFKKCHAIGVLLTEDEKGKDIKVISVPDAKIDPVFGSWNNLNDIPKPILDKIRHFFENYKTLEPGKWVKVKEFLGASEAKDLIEKSSR